MRGVIFTEMIEFVEEALGYEVADKMIEKAHLDNGGAFSQGGNYPFDQMVKMLTALSEITGKPPHELLFIFGEHLFSILVKLYGKDIKNAGSALDFIDSVEEYVHVEVKKLYPDADLPKFTTEEKDENHLVLVYESNKKLESFAKGLITACGKFFNEPLNVNDEIINETPHRVRFTITRV